MKNAFILTLLSLLTLPLWASSEEEAWKLTSSQLDQKVWVSKMGIAVGKEKRVTRDFSLKSYLDYQKKYKAKALSLLGARNWKVRERRHEGNEITLIGHYTDQEGRKVQFIETLHYSSRENNLKTLLLTKTDSEKGLKISNHQKKIQSFLNAL